MNWGFPHNWSRKQFLNDFKEIKPDIISKFHTFSYLEMYEKVIGEEKKLNDFQRRVFNVFNCGSIMLYFENVFIRLLYEKRSINSEMLNIMEDLTTIAIQNWDNYLSKIGAISAFLFINDPFSYLFYRVKDEDILRDLKYKMSYITNKKLGLIGPNYLRTNLVKEWLISRNEHR